MTKRIVFAFLVLGIFFLAGCIAQTDNVDEDQGELDLIKELQEIEKQLEEVEGEELEEEPLDQGEVLEELFNDEDVDTSTLQRIEVEETELVDLQVEAEDADEDALTYLFSPPLDDNGKWQTTYTDAGEYIVTIAASDGENIVEQKILLVVHKKNVAPTIDNLVLRLEVNEGDVVELELEVNDVNGDPVTVSYSAPLGEDGTWDTDHTSAGEYDVTVTASDGEAKTVKTLTLTVNNVNVPPEITGVEDEIVVDEGETVTLEPEVSDLDGDSVEVSISEPVGDDGEWETGFTDNGDYVVTVAASDGKDTVSKEVRIIVNDVNVPPKIISIRQG